MKFKEALELMKKGYKLKLPSWGGYWCWDDNKETIMMHCKDGSIIDIRETEDVYFTLSNVVREDWMVVDRGNILPVVEEETFGFEEALKYLKKGFPIKRKAWDETKKYIFLLKEKEISELFKDKDAEHLKKDFLAIKTKDDKIVVGWYASQVDLLAEDWTIAARY